MIRIFKKSRKKSRMIDPDEIFLDSKNIPGFNVQQFEGLIEKPISKKTFFWFSGFLIFAGILIVGRIYFLQIQKGDYFFKRSEMNNLRSQPLFSGRGIIYDRNKVELAWNDEVKSFYDWPARMYESPGFSHLLGYVSYPAKDSSGYYWQKDFNGKDGIEKMYDLKLKGETGSKIIEVDALGKVQSENIIELPKDGENILLSIDSRIQKELYRFIKSIADSQNYRGGTGILMDIESGEIIALTNYPEYDSAILSSGSDPKIISGYFTDSRKVFLNRAISGLYSPGSIVKPFFALGALNEKIIDPAKEIFSSGELVLPNPYNPKNPTIFKDWRANGWTDMRMAIAVSSDVYFYQIGGGFGSQKGLGILNIEKYSRMFGIGEKTGIIFSNEVAGVIPSPEWKLKNFAGDPWRIGDTYHTAIGQYGFQVTPIQMVRATATIANGGTMLTPTILLKDPNIPNSVENSKIDIPISFFNIVKEGMRQGVTEGTGSSLKVPYVEIATKTGTAQLGVSNSRLNSWIIGFFPYNNPRYAFTFLLDNGPSSNSNGATTLARSLFDWMSINTPEYFK